MGDERQTLETLHGLCRADVETAKLALAKAEHELKTARQRADRVSVALEALRRQRVDECRHFDRHVERHGTKIAELQLFEERLDGIAHETKRLERERDAAAATAESTGAKVRERRQRLSDLLADETLLRKRLGDAATMLLERAEDEAWDEREALAARKRIEEA